MEKQTDTYYYSVYRDIIVQIYTGTYQKGDVLPSLKELCYIYGVGRNTVRSALHLLQEHGYVTMEPRKQAVISFDIDNPKYQKFYLAEVVGRKEAVLQVYDFMELIMPEIFVYIQKMLSRSLRNEIAGLVGFFAENLSVKTEAKLQAGILQLFRLIIALPNNHLLEQLFAALISYVQLPVSSSEWDKLKFQAIAPFFKTTFKKFEKLVIAQEHEKLKKQIGLFCQMMKKKSDRYLTRIGKKIESEDVNSAFNFTWSLTGKSDYVQLASILISKIGREEYKNGDILPSYAQLAQENGVSVITSRNAIEILGRLELVSTINGVGTKVKGFDLTSRELFFKDMEMRKNIVSYFEALQLIIIISRPILHRTEEVMTEKDKADLKGQFLNQGLTSCFEVMLKYAGLPAALPVFECLKNELAWGYLINFDIEKDKAAKEQLIKQESSIAEWVYAGCQNYYQYARKIARENFIEIPFSIL